MPTKSPHANLLFAEGSIENASTFCIQGSVAPEGLRLGSHGLAMGRHSGANGPRSRLSDTVRICRSACCRALTSHLAVLSPAVSCLQGESCDTHRGVQGALLRCAEVRKGPAAAATCRALRARATVKGTGSLSHPVTSCYLYRQEQSTARISAGEPRGVWNG